MFKFVSILTVSVSAFVCSVVNAQTDYFGIQVVDEETDRGVPMVTLTTVNHIGHVTDSDGWIAFNEPGLMDKDVYFHVTSHGYEFPKDGFGYRGVRLTPKAGETTQIKIKRKNLAERLYRITGQGIYRDSVLLGLKEANKETVLNGGVLGQDTVQTAILEDSIYWFWGDTNRASYPLGQFKTSGARAEHHEQLSRGGEDGINLNYFVDKNGFSRQMAPIEGPGAVWLHGLFVVWDGQKQRMIAHYARMKSLGERLEHGLVQFNEEIQTFEKLEEFDDQTVLYPLGQAFHYNLELGKDGFGNEDEYFYFATPFASVRVKADMGHIIDPKKYQAYTCLVSGTRFDGKKTQIDRDESGKVVWAWKTDTDTMDARRQHELKQHGLLDEADFRFVMRPKGGEELVYCNAGSIHYNHRRDRWIMIAEQIGGDSSFLGEIWYADADKPEGPWENVVKVVTHDKYSFYNPAHHAFLDDGRYIYFEATYVTTFSKAPVATPRYDYNQIMYRLDLDHPDLPWNRE